ncbi:MAG: NAD(P)-dependent oxidoreductase, partial [Candidatus Omnitrophota bacterium]
LALALKEEGAIVDVIDSLQVNNLLSFASIRTESPSRNLYYRMVNERLDFLHKADIPIEAQDAREYHVLSRLLSRLKPQVIIHLAAVAHAGRSNKDPYSTFDHSLRTLENTLDYSKNDVEHFIYFSSSMVYGNFQSESVTEDTVCNPLGIYGALKFSGEKIVVAYNQVFNLPYTIVRPSALYGERCVSRRVGQIFIENALAGEPINVQGDGTDRLDFTYIGDLVQGIKKIIENENSKSQTLNLTHGESRSIKEMADVVGKHFPNLTINYLPKDKLMPNRGTLCVDKAKKLIGYDPQYSIEKGLAKYIDWYKSTYQCLVNAEVRTAR